MTIKQIFVLDTIVAGLFGAVLLVLPDPLIARFTGADAQVPSQIFLAHLLGGALIGIAATEWFARDASEAAALPIVKGILCYDILAVLTSIWGTLAGRVNGFGWLVVGLFLFFAVARISVIARGPK